MKSQAIYSVIREGRWWQVWDMTLQQCKGQFWSKAEAIQRVNELTDGFDRYALAAGKGVQ